MTSSIITFSFALLNLESVERKWCHIQTFTSQPGLVFLHTLFLKNLGSIIGCPYLLNGLKMSLSMTRGREAPRKMKRAF